MHLKLQKSLESKKVTEKGEYYFAKGFKHVVSCAKKNCSDLLNIAGTFIMIGTTKKIRITQ